MVFCVRGIQRHLVVMPQIATNLISPPLLTAPFFFAELMIALGSAFPVRAPDHQSCGGLKGTNFERIKERTKNNTEKHKLFSLKSNFHVSIFIILSLLLFIFFYLSPPNSYFYISSDILLYYAKEELVIVSKYLLKRQFSGFVYRGVSKEHHRWAASD